MIDDGNLRWCERRSLFVPPKHCFDPRGFDVKEFKSDTVAREFVGTHHYSGTLPNTRFRFGLYDHGTLVGVAAFTHPSRDCVLTNWFPDVGRDAKGKLRAVELGRFVLLEEVGFNGETYFLSRCFDLLSDRIAGVLSFSDPIPRTRTDGVVIMPGHRGQIYQAHNARYLGIARADDLWLLPDARVFSRRSYQKIRKAEVGWWKQTVNFTRYGADPLSPDADEFTRIRWLETWKRRLVRILEHPGNYRYAWPIQRRLRKTILSRWKHIDLPYPKKAAA